MRLHTNLGDLNLELHCNIVPRACENFIILAESGYYNNTVFHRSIKNFMIQARCLFQAQCACHVLCRRAEGQYCASCSTRGVIYRVGTRQGPAQESSLSMASLSVTSSTLALRTMGAGS